jgi:hypothetical protein
MQFPDDPLAMGRILFVFMSAQGNAAAPESIVKAHAVSSPPWQHLKGSVPLNSISRLLLCVKQSNKTGTGLCLVLL